MRTSGRRRGSTHIGAPVVRRRLKLSKGPLVLLLTGMIFFLWIIISLAGHLNPPPSSNDCGARFQATDVAKGKTVDKNMDQDIELWLIRNIHIKQFVRLL